MIFATLMSLHIIGLITPILTTPVGELTRNTTIFDAIQPLTTVETDLHLQPVRNWSSSGVDFPNPFVDSISCNHGVSNRGNRWVCDPDSILQSSQVLALSDKIQNVLSKMPCQCSRAMGCSNQVPQGRFSIGVAIMHNIDGAVSNLKKVQQISYGLRKNYWTNMKRCDDMVVLALMTSGKAVYYSPDPLVSVTLTSDCIRKINEATETAYQSGDWNNALSQSIDYLKNALEGGRCGTKSGLSVGQIVGIVFGVIAGVAMIVGLVICCIGFFQDWECVAGTCLGLCIGMILGAIQGCINAIIFSCVQEILGACGCEDCCECEPFDCLPEDSAEAGGGMEF